MGRGASGGFYHCSIDHALDGYRLSALKYIEKPVTPKDVAEILDLARLKKVHAPSLAVQWNGNEDLIPLSDILYLEQQGHVVHIHLKGGAIRHVCKKLSDMAGQLTGKPFFQSHKSFLVHLVFVRDINTDLKCFVMSDGKNIPIRRELVGKARRAWENWLFAHTRGNS